MDSALANAASPILVVVGIAALIIGALVAEPFVTRRRRRALRRQPFPQAWREILRRRVPMFSRLPFDLQQQITRQIRVFVAEKLFIGCRGLVITDEVRITIAAQACLLLLNRPAAVFPALRQILVYPDAFVVDRFQSDAAGVLQERRHVLAGESWSQGQVILSWEDVVDGAATVDDGRNVVLHEFAHQLDQQGGPANGAPPLPSADRYARWSRAFGDAYDALRARSADEPPSLICSYGAQSPAEFFAVATEVFFEQPQALAQSQPALYGELRAFYCVDPQLW